MKELITESTLSGFRVSSLPKLHTKGGSTPAAIIPEETVRLNNQSTVPIAESVMDISTYV